MDELDKNYGMGWLPDLPDIRDYTITHDEVTPGLLMLGQKDSVKDMLRKAGVADVKKAAPPATSDLRKWCSPIEDQGSLGACTAHAGVGLVEYFERKAFGRHIDASRRFLYKVTRNLLHLTGDTGAYLRSTMKAMVLFGVPPEEYWTYDVTDFDVEPPAFCYAFGQSYQPITYYRLDPPGTTATELLNRIRAYLAAGLPSMFGFVVYNSYKQANKTGEIPFPTSNEPTVGGHAVCAVGHDDNKEILNTNPGAKKTKGALLIRNSWGTSWGDGGYGWLPYEYILSGLAIDWWSLLKNEWLDSEIFKMP